MEFVRELKLLAGKCEFTNVQLNDILRDRFICGLRTEQIKRKATSSHTYPAELLTNKRCDTCNTLK